MPGVARVNMFGGTTQELRITVDPARMARYGLTVTEIADALRRSNASISAGDIEEGKRRYVVRTDGELNTPERVASVVLRSDSDPLSGRVGRVTMGDIATIAYRHKEPVARIRQLGEPALAVNAVRETGANVIETMASVKEAVAELNAAAIPQAGLVFEQVYDETVYIKSAIDLVQQNMFVGGALAALILLLFLRSFSATLIVSIAIPVSVVGSFVAMALLGRSINVISLAGLAFAVGMVVDAAIVVLENIYRLRQSGYGRLQAAYHGARQVWGAVFVSAATTVLVFVPILVMELEAGQLFRDIAVAISVSVVLSLIVASTVIPSLASRSSGADAGASVAPPVHKPSRRKRLTGFACRSSTMLLRCSSASSWASPPGSCGAVCVPPRWRRWFAAARSSSRGCCCPGSTICRPATATWCSASSCRRRATISKPPWALRARSRMRCALSGHRRPGLTQHPASRRRCSASSS